MAGTGSAEAATAPPAPAALQYSQTAIEKAYQANRDVLGEPAGNVECRAGGYPCWQTFTNGGLYVVAEFQQPIMVSGAIYLKWNSLGGLFGEKVGAPVRSMECDAALNCRQTFHNGTIYVQNSGPAILVPGDNRIYNS